MQRSRRALLQRRAVVLEETKTFEKQKLYKVSLSVVVLLWVLVFLLNSLISHGNGYRDELHEAVAESVSNNEENLNVPDSTPNNNYKNNPTEGEQYESKPAFPGGENYQNTLPLEGNDEENISSPKPFLLNNQELITEPETKPDNEESETEEERMTKDEEQEKEVEKEKKEEEREEKEEEEREIKEQEEREIKEEQKVKKKDHKETKEEDKEMNGQRTERVSRITPPPLDEFKNKAINSKGKTIPSQTGTVVHRVEPGGKEYNYASQSKGAKVLAFNKEAKGAANILDKDKDKYLRNPCSVEGKFVIIELSEETLVDVIVLANFEHYSSNLKNFEVFSSLVYPTENWDYVGGFVAQNSKHEQRFPLPEPKWARYLKIRFLSHYGSEFYCTLSSIEVYGVDAIERMLENLISEEKSKTLENVEDSTETLSPPPQENVQREEPSQENKNFEDLEKDQDNENKKPVHEPFVKPLSDPAAKLVPDPVTEARALQVGRIPGDAVLKVLMAKVQGLDVNFSVLERYLEELNSRYGQIFKDFDADMANFDLLLDRLKTEIKVLQASKETLVNELGDIMDWKLFVSRQMEKYLRDSDALRSEIEKVKERQSEMENKGLVVIFVSFIFWSLAIAKLLSGIMMRVCRLTVTDDEKFCRTNSAWLLLLLSSSIVAFIMVI